MVVEVLQPVLPSVDEQPEICLRRTSKRISSPFEAREMERINLVNSIAETTTSEKGTRRG
jgi:hypothetical protein